MFFLLFFLLFQNAKAAQEKWSDRFTFKDHSPAFKVLLISYDASKAKKNLNSQQVDAALKRLLEGEKDFLEKAKSLGMALEKANVQPLVDKPESFRMIMTATMLASLVKDATAILFLQEMGIKSPEIHAIDKNLSDWAQTCVSLFKRTLGAKAQQREEAIAQAIEPYLTHHIEYYRPFISAYMYFIKEQKTKKTATTMEEFSTLDLSLCSLFHFFSRLTSAVPASVSNLSKL